MIFKYLGWKKYNGKIDWREIRFDIAVISLFALLTWAMIEIKGLI